ncbi:hypothetical protein, partial [Persicitalea sp.]|uniref:hypothetical protein n=1 Tax=Persicitalea sp. TaxID=3100273 RepID=UPI0035934EEE
MKFNSLFFALALILSSTILHAQGLKFSEEPGAFMAEAKKIMQDSRNPLYAKTAAELDTIWMSAPSSVQQTQFA